MYKDNKVYKHREYLEYFIYGQLELPRFTHMYGPDNPVCGQLDLASLLSIISLLLTNCDSFYLQTMKGWPTTGAKLWKSMSTMHIEKPVCQLLARKLTIYYAYVTEHRQFWVDFWLAGWPVNQTHCRLTGLEWFN